ncbi:MAG: DNA methyltransferase [Vicingaceae bacterium]
MINTIEITKFDSKIKELLYSYQRDPNPIEVNFRGLIPELNNADRYTHLIHTYPAKLLPHIPYFFLNNSFFSKPGDNVLDPFCGSGTVLLESILSGRNAYGVDANPLARLISQVKISTLNAGQLEIEFNHLKKSILKSSSVEFSYPDVVNIDYWFLPHIKNQLSEILASIKKIKSQVVRDFFMLCFSNCSKKVSLADPRVSVPVRLKHENYPKDHPFRAQNIRKLEELKTVNVLDKFSMVVSENLRRLKSYNAIESNLGNGKLVSNNAKKILSPLDNGFNGLKEETVDLIITSPPYAGAQKYVRASSLNLGWTELAKSNELKELDKLSIGRENYRKYEYSTPIETGIDEADKLLKDIYAVNPLRAHIASNYLVEMRIALSESVKTLKVGGHLVLVAANNQVCKKEFRTQEYLRQIAESLGLKLELRLIDDIKSYGLMTKRNKTASIITREWILVFKKL